MATNPTNLRRFRRSTGSLDTCREPKVGTERDKTMVRDILRESHNERPRGSKVRPV